MLGVVPQWWRLLLVPWHLQSDYMPLELDRADGFGIAQGLGLVLLVAWGWVAWAGRARSPAVTFGLGWVAVTIFPVSNILIPTGILLAERTLVLPSLGVCLALGGTAPWVVERIRAAARSERVAAGAIVAGILLLYGGRSAVRAQVWRSDQVLIPQTVIDAPLSYRAHAVLGKLLFAAGDPTRGEQEYLVAIKLYPHDPNVFAGLAKHYRDAGLFPPAVRYFRQALALEPRMPLARSYLIDALARSGDSTGAAAELAEKARLGEADSAVVRQRIDSIWRHPSQ
jgi:tetratricopeptide (TPR) repeat protein